MIDPALCDREISIKKPYFSEDYLKETYNMSLEEFSAAQNAVAANDAAEPEYIGEQQVFSSLSEEGLLEYPPYVPHYDKYEPVAINPQAIPKILLPTAGFRRT
jgi:hypothetical protein